MKISKVIQSRRISLNIINNTLLEECFIEEKFNKISLLQTNEINVVINATETIVGRYSISYTDNTVFIGGSAKSIEIAIEKFIEICNNGEIWCLAEEVVEGYIELPEIYTKNELFSVLQRVYEDKEHTIIGRQVQGVRDDCISFYENQFKRVMGDFPGILGIDLGCYGIDVQNKNDVQISKFICDIVDYCGKGGILTVSSHMDNPSGNIKGNDRCRGVLGYDDTKEGYEKAFCDLITEGTELNNKFKQELLIEGNFLKLLMKNNIPLIFRPLHEFNGSWFWFCSIQNGYRLDPAIFVNLWRYIHELYTNELGLTNLIWNYSPNVYNEKYSQWCSESMYLYVGDDWCDMVGIDWYTGGNLEISNNGNYELLIEKSGKIGAINEFGATLELPCEEHIYKYNSIDTYRDLVKLKKMGMSFTYLLSWFGFEKIGYGSDLMKSGICLGRDEVMSLLKDIRDKKEKNI